MLCHMRSNVRSKRLNVRSKRLNDRSKRAQIKSFRGQKISGKFSPPSTKIRNDFFCFWTGTPLHVVTFLFFTRVPL